MTPDVSVLLLTLNGGATLDEVLDRVRGQAVDFDVEVVAVDSGSSDGTLDTLKRHAVRVLPIARSEFDHGATRNHGIAQTRGRYVVLLVQDALPADEHWLSELVAPLAADATLAGTYARQLPRPDASALTRFYLERWVAASEIPRTTRISDRNAFDNLPAFEKFMTCVFDDVCSCVRREAWVRYPFPRARIAEDVQWARDVLLAGYGIAFVPSSRVIHSHDRPARYELMRTYVIHQRLRQLFGMATVPTIGTLARSIATTIPTHLRHTFTGSSPSAWRSMPRALSLAVAFPLGQYLGARSADRNREYLRVSGI